MSEIGEIRYDTPTLNDGIRILAIVYDNFTKRFYYEMLVYKHDEQMWYYEPGLLQYKGEVIAWIKLPALNTQLQDNIDE